MIWESYVGALQASLLGEAITGKGILAQLNLETGIPIYEAEPLLLFFILFTLLGAIGALGDRGRFVDDDPPTGIEGAVIPPGKGLRSALGLREGGKLIRPQYIHFYRSSTADTCILSFTFHCCVRSSIWIHKVEWAVCGKIGSVGHRLLYNWRNNYREGSSGTTEHRDRSSD